MRSNLHFFAIVALAACIDAPDLDDNAAELTASYKAHVKSRILTITGTNAASKLTLRLGATPTILEVDVGSDGSADFRFDRSTFERIVVDASGGNDVITIDESAGAFTTEEQVTLNGGSGDDTIVGGFGPERIDGGAGNDTIDGRFDTDTISLGAGDDLVLWSPGSGSDVIDGGDGRDTLVFTGSVIGEQIALSADGDRVRLTRDVATITLDLRALEVVDVATRGGDDRVTVGDVTGTAVAEVDVDLADGAGQPDGAADAVVVDGTLGADTTHVARDADAVAVTGLVATVRVANGEPALDRLIVNGDASDRVNIDGSPAADQMTVIGDSSGALYDGGNFGVLVVPSVAAQVTVNGLGGDDRIATQSVVAPLVLDGGDGNDEIVGGYGADRLIGGPGNDLVFGSRGDDTALLGDGDDTYGWNPGDGSDVVDGEAGMDALRFFGSAANEAIDVGANGARVRLFRDVASITLDLGGIERMDVRALGGTDTIALHSLAGTPTTEVAVDLAAVGQVSGDAAADVVLVDGGPATIDVAAEGTAVAATGIGARLIVSGGEPALDRMVVSAAALNVNGSAGADTMRVIADAGGALYDGGGFTLLVAPSPVQQVTVKGNGGDDTIGTAGTVTTPLILDGGDGNDQIFGGAAADRLVGGPGNDVVAGGFGNDTVLLGDGDDTFVWDPGGASDIVDGEAGNDALIFHASNANEMIDLRANGSRARLFRDIATVTLDLGTIEQIDVTTRGGSDTVAVGDLTGTSIARVNLDLAGSDGATGDATLDAITVLGSALDDAIAIAADAGGIVVSGLPATVRIAHPDATDQLAVHGAGGSDTFLIGSGVSSLIALTTDQD